MQVYVYCCTPRLDSKSVHLRTTTEAAGCFWRTVASMHEKELAELIRADRIDVLIELTGAPSTVYFILYAFSMSLPESSPRE